MKPFSLERFLAGDPVVCRNGTVPSELHYFETITNSFKIRGVVDGVLLSWCVNGDHFENSRETSPFDLFMAPRTVEKWVYVYPSGAVLSGVLHDSEEACREYMAERSLDDGRAAKVMWKE